MTRIIIFRFHKDIGICLNRLKLLNKFNPNVDIYGIYGGEEKDFSKYQEALNKYFKHLYCIKNKSSR